MVVLLFGGGMMGFGMGFGAIIMLLFWGEITREQYLEMETELTR